MAFKDMTLAHRIIAVHLDIMKHKDFSLMGGVTQVGKVNVLASTDDMKGFIEHIMVPTAGTDGCDVYYNEQFCKDFTREQLRYLVLHENFHKALHHCTEYTHLAEKYPEIFAQAIDYVVNDQIETIDPDLKFVARPTNIPPLIDPKYHDMSVPQVMKMLIDEQKDKDKEQGKKPDGEGGEGGQPGKGKPGKGKPGPMDTHIMRKPGTGSGQPGEDEMDTGGLNAKELKKQLVDAVNQGAIVRNKLRGEGGGGNALSGFQERNTDWRTPLRQFVQELCEGDDQSRFSPPNKRMLPLGIILPSHFSEATGELIVACDTSGSMHGLYPTVFGEIARICKEAVPAKVRVIWWGDHIEGEQVFEPKDYDKIRDLMSPKGGGGTVVSCVARHIVSKQYKPKATIMLTDGWVESQYDCAPGPLLWGVVDNENFVPLKGKVIHISSVGE
jgi:predicted metal-dependent peptidase